MTKTNEEKLLKAVQKIGGEMERTRRALDDIRMALEGFGKAIERLAEKTQTSLELPVELPDLETFIEQMEDDEK